MPLEGRISENPRARTKLDDEDEGKRKDNSEG